MSTHNATDPLGGGGEETAQVESKVDQNPEHEREQKHKYEPEHAHEQEFDKKSDVEKINGQPNTSTDNSITEKELEVLEPPQNFAMVEPGLYRSSLPGSGTSSSTSLGGGNLIGASSSSLSSLSSSHGSFLRGLRLRTAIILSSEKPVRSVTNVFTRVGARIIHTGLHGWSLLDDGGSSTTSLSWKPMADEVVKDTIELILHAENYPILLCDVGGVYNVGMVVACLRRLQGWNLTSVINEYCSFAAARSRYVNEQFIELFDIDLITVPPQPPAWFVNLANADATDYQQFQRLVQSNCLDESGTLVADFDDKGHEPNQEREQEQDYEREHKLKQERQAKQQRQSADAGAIPKHKVYYFSTAAPLNSDFNKAVPRIQTM